MIHGKKLDLARMTKQKIKYYILDIHIYITKNPPRRHFGFPPLCSHPSYQALPPSGRSAAALMRLGQAITRFSLTSFLFPPLRARHFFAFLNIQQFSTSFLSVQDI